MVVDKLPKPRFKELRDMGFGDFLDTEFDAITYKNTYYFKSTVENMLELHFHELVHVIQWDHLGASKFLDQYISEIRNVGYKNVPLEKMAYNLQDNYEGRYQQINIESYVEQNLGQRF